MKFGTLLCVVYNAFLIYVLLITFSSSSICSPANLSLTNFSVAAFIKSYLFMLLSNANKPTQIAIYSSKILL